MNAFTQAVERWHDFYMMVGTSAATLLGSLFAGGVLRGDDRRRDPGRTQRNIHGPMIGRAVIGRR